MRIATLSDVLANLPAVEFRLVAYDVEAAARAIAAAGLPSEFADQLRGVRGYR